MTPEGQWEPMETEEGEPFRRGFKPEREGLTEYQRRSLEQRERAASRPTAGRSDKLTRQFESAKAKAGEADARWRQLSGMIGQPYGKDTVTQAHVETAAREQEAAKLQFEGLKANVRSAGIPLDASGEGIDYDALARVGSGAGGSTSQTISPQEYQQAVQKHGQAAVDEWLRGKGISVAWKTQGARSTDPRIGKVFADKNGKRYRIAGIDPDGQPIGVPVE